MAQCYLAGGIVLWCYLAGGIMLSYRWIGFTLHVAQCYLAGGMVSFWWHGIILYVAWSYHAGDMVLSCRGQYNILKVVFFYI